MNRTDRFLISPSSNIHLSLLSSSTRSEIVGIYREDERFQSLGFSSDEDPERSFLFIGSSSVALERFHGLIIFFSSSIDSGSSSIASTFPETCHL